MESAYSWIMSARLAPPMSSRLIPPMSARLTPPMSCLLSGARQACALLQSHQSGHGAWARTWDAVSSLRGNSPPARCDAARFLDLLTGFPHDDGGRGRQRGALRPQHPAEGGGCRRERGLHRQAAGHGGPPGGAQPHRRSRQPQRSRGSFRDRDPSAKGKSDRAVMLRGNPAPQSAENMPFMALEDGNGAKCMRWNALCNTVCVKCGDLHSLRGKITASISRQICHAEAFCRTLS